MRVMFLKNQGTFLFLKNYGHQGRNRGFVHLIFSPTEENLHPTLNLGYPKFEKSVQAILGKKRKTRTSTDGISSPTNLSKQSQNEDIPGTTAKKEDQLEIVGSNQNIFLPKNTAVSCDKLGDTSTITTDNQHVDNSIVTYQHMDLLMSFFFVALKSLFYCY